MKRFRNILVGVDLSHADRLASDDLNPPTKEAVDHAIWLAGKLGAELTFVSAVELSVQARQLIDEEAQGGLATVEKQASAVLEELAARARQFGVQAKHSLTFGKAWTEIIRSVLREKHDLVVAGTRDLHIAGRILLGSTGMKLLRKCPCPVWIVKPGFRREGMNVLVASDLSEISTRALEIIVGGAQLADMKVHLLHVSDDFLDKRILLTGLPEDKVIAFRAKTRALAEETLNRQMSQIDHHALAQPVQVHVVDGEAHSAILDAVEEYKIDLLVMGTAARHGVPGMLIGNTAERLLPHVTCSVLAVKPPDFPCPVTLD